MPLQTASLTAAAARPPTYTGIARSSRCASWTVPALRPRLMHWPVNAWFTAAGSVPAMRLSTVLAACAPSGMAAWQLIRNGVSDGAAASPAATMYGLSTLVSVSSVSRRPIASVASPLRVARSGTPNPAVQIVSALASWRPSASCTARRRTSVTFAPGPSMTVTPSLRMRLATALRAGLLRYGPSTPPHTNVTAYPSSPSSAAVSIPVGPAPTTVTGASDGSAATAARRGSAYSNSETGWANSAAPGTVSAPALLPTA